MAIVKPTSRPAPPLDAEPGAPSLAGEPPLGVGTSSAPRGTPAPLRQAATEAGGVIGVALAWAGFSFWLSLPWIETLGQSITMPLAIAVIFGIAIIPGYLNANLIASLLIDRPPPLRFDLDFPPVTIAVACFEEEETIEETLDYRRQAGLPRRAADPGRRRRVRRPHRRRRAAALRRPIRASTSSACLTAARRRP